MTNALPAINTCPFCGHKKPKIHCRAMAFGKDAPMQRYLAQVICNKCFARGPITPFPVDIIEWLKAGTTCNDAINTVGTPANTAATAAIQKWNSIKTDASASTEGA